jgi:hypothetical protein
MLGRPRKPIDGMTPEEIRQGEAWLRAEGINPSPIRQDIPPGTSSYAFDPALNATIEYVGDRRYFVGIVDGRIARLAPVESALEPANTPRRPFQHRSTQASPRIILK